jgi:RelB Antitoxin alpha helical domain
MGGGCANMGSRYTFIAAFSMFALRRNYILDENQQPIAVQISLDDFQRLEAILEDYGLARLMDDVPEADRQRFSKDEGMAYYTSLKQNHVES